MYKVSFCVQGEGWFHKFLPLKWAGLIRGFTVDPICGMIFDGKYESFFISSLLALDFLILQHDLLPL